MNREQIPLKRKKPNWSPYCLYSVTCNKVQCTHTATKSNCTDTQSNTLIYTIAHTQLSAIFNLMAGYSKQLKVIVTSASLAQRNIKTNHSQDNIQRVKTFEFKTCSWFSESAYLLEGVCVDVFVYQEREL